MHNPSEIIALNENSSLAEIMKTMSEISELSDLHEYILDQGIEYLNAENGCIVRLNKDGSLGFPAVRHNWKGKYHLSEDPISGSVLSRIILSREPILTTNASEDPRFSDAHSVIQLNLRSILCAPLIAGNKLIGAIYIENRSLKGFFTPEDLDTLVDFSDGAAQALSKFSTDEII